MKIPKQFRTPQQDPAPKPIFGMEDYERKLLVLSACMGGGKTEDELEAMLKLADKACMEWQMIEAVLEGKCAIGGVVNGELTYYYPGEAALAAFQKAAFASGVVED